MKFLNPESLPSLAVADYATTPSTYPTGTIAWSSTNSVFAYWNGTFWRMIPAVPSATSLVSEITASGVATDTGILTLTIPANAVSVGTQYEIEAYGQTDNTTTVGTFNLWTKLNGSTKLATVSGTTTATAATAKPWYAEFMITFRTTGASGTLMAASQATITGATSALPVLVSPTATTTVATNASITLQLGMNWTAAVTGNIGRCDHASIYQTVGAPVT